MKYSNMERAYFKERPNRFIAYVETEKGREICHVKNTGRCRELLPEGAQVILADEEGKDRKTRYDLVAVKKQNRIIGLREDFI